MESVCMFVGLQCESGCTGIIWHCCAGKDAETVDNDWFLCPVKIFDHEGPFITSFPVENRLIPQVLQPGLAEQLLCCPVVCCMGCCF